MKRISFTVLLALLQIVLITISVITGVYGETGGLAIIFPTAFKGTRTAGPDNRWTTVDLDHASFIANLWNLAAGAQGTMTMEFTGTYAEVYGEFTDLPKQLGVQGGPGIRYGRNIWGGNPPAHPLYRIPRKLTELPYAIFFANYTIYEEECTLPVTATLFVWTVKSVRDGGTKAGDVLVIVRHYRHPEWPVTGEPQAVVVAPILINNTLEYREFGVYVGNIDRSADSHTTVSFEITTPISNGRVGIPIQEFVALAANILSSLRPDIWTREDVIGNILQMIDYTIEWGSNLEGGGKFRWRLYEVSFLVGATVIKSVETVTIAHTITTVSTVTETKITTIATTVRETVTQPVTSTISVTLTVPTVSTVVSTVSVPSTVMVTQVVTQKVREVDFTYIAGIGVAILLLGIFVGVIIRRHLALK
ncbi:MAG: hypothetical protein QXD67_04370 [Ignisphaera sp.]